MSNLTLSQRARQVFGVNTMPPRFIGSVRILLFSAILLFTPQIPAEDLNAGLVAHWPFQTDWKELSSLDATAVGISMSSDSSGFRGRRSAIFDGRKSVITVKESSVPRLGSGEFSISLWVHTDNELDDSIGDLVSWFDSSKRTGFNLSIQNHAGITSSHPNQRNIHFGIDQARQDADWVDHGRLGNAMYIYSMAVYKDQLFVGTCEAGESESGRVFKFNGTKWSDCGSPDRCNSVSNLAVYRGDLYAGVSQYRLRGSSLAESENPNRGGAVYRYQSDGTWRACGRLPDAEAIGGMVVFKDQLYAGSLYAPAGFFRYDGGEQWISCGVPTGDTSGARAVEKNRRVESMTVYNGSIFATGYDEGAVYRFDGSTWHHLGVLPEAHQTYGFATYRGKLYVSEWPHAKVFRWAGGRRWEFAGKLGDELETMPLMVYNGKLYAGTLPNAEVYRYDEPEWTKVARLDHTPDVKYRRTWSMAVFQGRLFAGTLPSGHVHSVEVGKNVTYDRALSSGWNHIAVVRATDRLLLYVNGRKVAESTEFRAADYDLNNRQPLRIGFGANDYFKGRLSDVRLYDRSLSRNEVTVLATP